jgi:hypothetical protein
MIIVEIDNQLSLEAERETSDQRRLVVDAVH